MNIDPGSNPADPGGHDEPGNVDHLMRHPALAGIVPGAPGGSVAPPDVATSPKRDAYRGALLGTAIGDALGRPAEGRRSAVPESERNRFADYQRWHGWRGGPEGTITDDTQMTICVAESLIATDGVLDPVDLADRFIGWLPIGRRKGATCVAACRALTDGVDWWEAGDDSAGNGAAMRSAPIGLANPTDFGALRHDAAVAAWITHANPMAVVSAVAHAWLIARLVATEPGHLDPVTLIDELCTALDDCGDPGEIDRGWRARGLDGTPTRLVDRIAEIPGTLGMTPTEAADHFHCGAFVLESLPMALWHFLSAPDQPETTIVNAVMGGFDADTVASMTGAYVGTYLGETALPFRWRGDDLEDATKLRALADALFEIGTASPSPSPSRGGGTTAEE